MIGQPPHAIAGEVGVTTLTVSDIHNSDNFASIQLEVQPVHHLRWLQDRVEALSQKQLETQNGQAKEFSDGISTLNTIAVDA